MEPYETLYATSDRQKSYADLKGKGIEFDIGNDKVFLKVLSWKKVLCFGRKGMLNLKFIMLYEILERIRLIAYRLALPSELDKIQMYRYDPSYGISPDEIKLQLDLKYGEEMVKILAQGKSCNNPIFSVAKKGSFGTPFS
ncbi:DNA/RNA polymerases superfamily protein [Gossypium australe]|uniref:DNA/RNA polymerases superfamily protein n=1 Tax=Gossypium australe TaxID=47621 RepID=A0A5B6VYP2_9ROSI|nr:DNA/RNA polymerases superfamily protein [Gossypium australe]